MQLVNNIKLILTALVHICMSANRAMVLAKKRTHSEDDLNNKDMSQKKLLSPEAQRISSTLENCISQVEFAAALPTVLPFNSVSSVVDKELSKALQDHEILDKRLERLIGLKQESEEEQEGTFGKARAQLEKDIKNSVRDLLRVVRAHPDALCGFRTELGMEVGESEYMLISGLKKFHSHVVEQLLTSPDEELLLLHKQVSSSPAQDLEHLVLLEAEVATSLKQIDERISEKNVEIQNLQIGLNGDIRQDAGVSLVEKQRQSHIKAAKVKHTSINQEIDRLNSQLNNLILENREAERVIQTKNEKVEEEIEDLLLTFDDAIAENQANLELNTMDYEMEEEEIMTLKTPFSALEVEYNQIQEKHQLAEKKRIEAMKELELKTKAAIFIQAWWREYSADKALKNEGKSKKAKEGKGKKTK